jgi:capsular exopolysaccharide synthesis family protein
MEIKYYLTLLRHWAWLLILGLVLGAASAFGFSYYQSPVYRASTSVQVISAPKGNSSDYSFIAAQQLAQTYVQTIKTSPIIDAVSQKLGYAVELNQISAAIVPNTQLIKIAVEDDSPQRATDIANTLVTVFVQRNAELQALQFSDSEESLKSQIAQIETQIESLQTQSSAASDARLQESIDKTRAEMDRLQSEIVSIKAVIFTLNNREKIGKETPTPAPDIISKVNEKELQLKQLQSTYDLYNQIYANLVVLGASSVKNDNSAQQLQSTLALYQQIRANLLGSYESIRLARLTSTSNIVSVEPAVAPFEPIRPRIPTNTGLGAVVGLLIAAAIVFLLEYLDDTLKTVEQISQLLGLPVIGYIAEIEHPRESAYVSDNPRSPVAEAFRTLRTNLEFAGVDQPLKSLLVVSVHPGEGKSTIAANLAVTLAQGGKHVLLLDADLRRPQVHRIFGLSNCTGLTDMFRESFSLTDLTRPWSNPNLGIITSGDIPPNPADLLASKKMESILTTAKQAADMVIVDAPPFLVADASILASRMDGVLLVIRPGKTPTDAALSTLEQMKRAGARIVGVVMNRIPRNRPTYYGGYRHYTGYYKGYSAYDEASIKTGAQVSRKWSLKNLFGTPKKISSAPEPADLSK